MKTLLKVLLSLIILVALLIAISPQLLKNYAERQLNQNLKTYETSIERLELDLFKFEYTFYDIVMNRKNIPQYKHFLKFPKLVIDLSFKDLLKGEIYGDVLAIRPSLQAVNFKKDAQDQLGQKESQKSWKESLDTIIPITIDRLEIQKGEVVYFDETIPVNNAFSLERIDLKIRDIKTRSHDQLSPLQFNAWVEKSANAKIIGHIDYLARPPVYDLDFRLENLDLAQLNNVLYKYIPVDFKKGALSLYGEYLQEKDFKQGYVKLFFDEIDVISKEDTYQKEGKLFNEISIAVTDFLLENPVTDKTATELQFIQRQDKIDIDQSTAVWSTLKNMFVGLTPAIEERLSL